MPIGPGARFGPYEILGSVGAGGMGEVYRARDPRLGREVAVKVLPPQFAGDPDRLRRFELEARAAGALNHPNVLGVLDLGSENGHPYVVSELLEGETLRQRLRVAALTPKKAMEVAVQIAHGLAAAHDKGIVHRDLKPENLFVTREGRLKILDFGLAKLSREGSPEDEVTLASGDTPPAGDGAATEAGAILGTVGYMSPEQVRGLPADARSDIFSFGVVLYEMISGRRPFARDTHAETLTAILKDDPPELAETHPNLPPALERVVRRCLEKSPDERFHSARDVAYAIDALSSSSPGRATPAVPAASARPAGRTLATGLGLALLAVVAGYVWRAAREAPALDLGAYRFTPIAMEPGYEGFPAWSPDGNTLAYLREVQGVLQVFTRGLTASMPSQITRSPRDCREPFWSSDGAHVYFLSQAAGDESLWRVSAAGGTPSVVQRNVARAALSPDGKTLVFLREESGHGGFFRSLWVASPPGAEPRRYAQPPLADRRYPDGYLRFAPDGSKLAFWHVKALDKETTVPLDIGEFWILPLPSGAPRQVLSLNSLMQPFPFDWMPDSRHVVFGTDTLSGTPGMHLYRADTETGAVEPLTATNGSEASPAVSPDGRQIAYTAQEEEYHLIEIPLDGSPYRSMTSGSRMETDPVWSPLGNQYAYVSGRTGRPEIWLRSRDGSFEKQVVTSTSFKGGSAYILAELAFSPGGERLAYQTYQRQSEANRSGGVGFSIWVSTIAGGPPVALPMMRGATYLDFPTWSPDGEWVAFTYMRAGTWGLAKVRPGGGDDPVVIKENIVYPSSPRWSPRGDWITCDTPEGFAVVSPDGQKTRVLSDETWIAHGWSKDGTTLYAIRQTEDLHFQLTSLAVATGQERVVTNDLGPTPPTSTPLRGFSLSPDGKGFLTSIVRLRGDVWLLGGFPRDEGFFARLFSRASPPN
jgi:Tol biopolymer transport system component